MLTNVKSPSPVLVMICRKSVSICNRFHTIRANSGKITLKRYPYLVPSFEGTLLPRGTSFLYEKLESLAQFTVKIAPFL